MVAEQKEKYDMSVLGCSDFFYTTYTMTKDENVSDAENRIVGTLSIDELINTLIVPLRKDMAKKCLEDDFYFYGSGWQSWGFGGEIEPGKTLKKYIPIAPQFKHYIGFPGTPPRRIGNKHTNANGLLKGQFIIYLRWGCIYLAVVSTGNIWNGVTEPAEPLPPVQFYVDRNTRTITASIYADGKLWRAHDTLCRLTVFAACGFFSFKDGIQALFGGTQESRFRSLAFLNTYSEQKKLCFAGWESWYNHYARINERLICEDLAALSKNQNIINTLFIQEKKPVVFQVDDGWEKGLGEWDAWEERFPSGMKNLCRRIADSGYIPGLWIAPFIIDIRTDFAKAHPDWILRNKKKKPIAAGLNFLWGAPLGKEQPSFPWSYFCWDISRDDVLSYLDALMEKIINEWGFRYVKLDFLFAGLIYGEFQKGGAAYQWYDRAIRVLTKRTVNKQGENVAYLGCGIPFEASFNAFPLSRIGPDTKEAWDTGYLDKVHFTARPGAKPNVQSTLGHAFWNQSVFINDPDVIFLRFRNISLDDNEKELIALVNYFFASQTMHSDDPAEFDEEERAFTAHITQWYTYFEGEEWGLLNITREWYVLFSRSGLYCGLLNLSEKPFTQTKEELLQKSAEGIYNADVGNAVDSITLVPLIDHCITADNTYTAEKHTISLFKIEANANKK